MRADSDRIKVQYLEKMLRTPKKEFVVDEWQRDGTLTLFVGAL